MDYAAEVWVNSTPVGGHSGGETPFVLDVTQAIKPNATNRLAVRVLNPTHEAIEGQRNFRGRLAGLADGAVLLKWADGRQVRIPRGIITRARLEIEL